MSFPEQSVPSSGRTVSPWIASRPSFDASPLDTDAQADVCVIGAGIAGLSVAYEVAREGRSVLVLDQAEIGSGQTGRTTAHFSNAFDDRYAEVERMHGETAARLTAESHTAAIARAARIVTDEEIHCGLVHLDGWLFVPRGESTDVLERELDAARRAGLANVELVPRAPLAFDTGPALRFPGQVQLHPLAYLAGLARAIVGRGGRIHTNTRVVAIEGGAEARVRTDLGRVVRARWIVVATNSPVNDLLAIHMKQAAYQTYAIAVRVPKDSVVRALYWDTGDPYHYVRLHDGARGSDHELLIVGGEDHPTGHESHPEDAWSRLEEWTREVFPHAAAVEHAWSGEVMEPVDGLAFIGTNPLDDDNVFIVTGDSGNGMTHGVIAGLLLRDLIAGRDHPWRNLYDPRRWTLRSAGELTRHGLKVAKGYARWLSLGEVHDEREIPRGEGAIVRRGFRMLAVYHDESGVVHERDAACTHMGCVVRWNRAEKTWDCPCHGSRFEPTGRAVQGPANSALGVVD